ncbi:conjugative transposon protein TraM, partial [Bacteroides ovatus]
MMKINFKQPKYIFPLVVFVPLCALVYFVMQTFGGGGDTRQTVATDRINMELPEANAEEAGDKMTEMSRRFGDEDAFTAVGAIGEEEKDKEELEHGYSEEELNRLDAAEAERIRQQQEMEELERSLAESRKHINSYAYGSGSSGNAS